MIAAKFLYVFKKGLIRFIEKIPVGVNKQKQEEKDAPFTLPFQICGHLLRNLPIKENDFRFIAGFSHTDARSYYLYAVVSEILSSSMSCMRVNGWIEDSEEERLLGTQKVNPGNETISGERIKQLLHRGVVDEFEVRFRKHQEYLCNLICFSETPDQEYFRLFLAASALEDIKYANRDIIEFFGKPIKNFENQADDLLKLCRKLIKDLDRNKCWFLAPDIDFNGKPGSNIMSSYNFRYKKALKIATNGEKIVLGPTYKVGYGGASKSAHALTEEPFKKHTFDDVKGFISKIPLIGFSILSRVFEISKIECPKGFQGVLACAKDGEGAARGIESVTRRDLERGDLVTTAGDDVAEVMDVHESAYGYRTYHVKYLINPKIKEISDEWLPPRYIGPCLMKKRNVRAFIVQNVLPLLGDVKDGLDRMSDEELGGYAKRALIDMTQRGDLKLFLLRR